MKNRYSFGGDEHIFVEVDEAMSLEAFFTSLSITNAVREAKIDGGNLLINSHRSFSSPAGDVVVEFKEVWSVNGNVLTIQKTRIQSGDSSTEKAVYDKL